MSGGWALALLLAAGQADPDTLTLAEARALPPPALAHRVLGMAGTLMREAMPQGGGGLFSDPAQLIGVTFAGPPHAGWPGLCTAEVVQAMFAPLSQAERGGPARLTAIDRTTVYRIVDAGPVPADVNSDRYAKRLAAACAAQPPVLSSPTTLSYFYSRYDGRPDSNGLAAQFVARLLGRMAHLPVVPRCEMRFGETPDCRGLVARFAAQPISEAEVKRCDPPPSTSWCVAMRNNGWLDWTAVMVRIMPPGDLTGPAIIRAVTLQDVHAVE